MSPQNFIVVPPLPHSILTQKILLQAMIIVTTDKISSSSSSNISLFVCDVSLLKVRSMLIFMNGWS